MAPGESVALGERAAFSRERDLRETAAQTKRAVTMATARFGRFPDDWCGALFFAFAEFTRSVFLDKGRPGAGCNRDGGSVIRDGGYVIQADTLDQ